MISVQFLQKEMFYFFIIDQPILSSKNMFQINKYEKIKAV